MALKLNDIFPELIRNIRVIEKAVIQRGWKKASSLMEEDIIKSIERGASPVEGEKRFKKYSDSYIKAIKKGYVRGKTPRPVNLTVDGGLLRSIKTKRTNDGFNIGFTKTVKGGKNLAEIHSREGAGKSQVIRKIIPDEDGDYKKSVKKRATEYLIGVTNQVLARTLGRFR